MREDFFRGVNECGNEESGVYWKKQLRLNKAPMSRDRIARPAAMMKPATKQWPKTARDLLTKELETSQPWQREASFWGCFLFILGIFIVLRSGLEWKKSLLIRKNAENNQANPNEGK